MTNSEILQRFEEDYRVFLLQTKAHEQFTPDQLRGIRSVFQSGFLKGAMFGAESTAEIGGALLLKAIDNMKGE